MRAALGPPLLEDEGAPDSLSQDVYGDVEFEFCELNGAVLIQVSLYEESDQIRFSDRDAFAKMTYCGFSEYLATNKLGFEHRPGGEHPTQDSSFKLESGVLVTVGTKFVTTMGVVDEVGLNGALRRMRGSIWRTESQG